MLDNDDDDETLAVHADALATSDQARGELITTQLALAALGIEDVEDLIASPLSPDGYARAAALLRRQNVLCAAHRPRWSSELFGEESTARVEFRRGRLVGVACGVDDIEGLEHALATVPTLRELQLTHGRGQEALDDLGGVRDIDRITVLRSSGFDFVEKDASALVRAMPRLARLRWNGRSLDHSIATCLALDRVRASVRDDALDQVTPAFARARDLSIGCDSDRVLDGRFSGATRIVTGVPRNPVGALPPELVVSIWPEDADALAALFASPAMATVRELHVDLIEFLPSRADQEAGVPAPNGELGNTVIAALARADLASLETLALSSCFEADGAPLVHLRAPRLANLSCDAKIPAPLVPAFCSRFPLHTLSLRRIDGEDVGERVATTAATATLRALSLWCVTIDGVRALARSPHVRRLRRLELGPRFRSPSETYRGAPALTPREPIADLLRAMRLPELVALAVDANSDPVAATARHANLVEVRTPTDDPTARQRLCTRFGDGVVDPRRY